MGKGIYGIKGAWQYAPKMVRISIFSEENHQL